MMTTCIVLLLLLLLLLLIQAGRTALYLATQRGQTSIVEMLVDKFHANVSSRSNDGSTLMHVAAMCGNADTAMWRVAPHVAWCGLFCMSTTPRPPCGVLLHMWRGVVWSACLQRRDRHGDAQEGRTNQHAQQGASPHLSSFSSSF